MPDLNNATAIVTGASRGIGAATALELARRGARVVLAARDAGAIEAHVETIRKGGGSAIAVACDVSIYDDVKTLVERCCTEFGRLDILINNAGVIDPIGSLTDSEPRAWSHAIDINLKGVYHGLRAALPVMVAQSAGVVINLSSGAATGVLEGWSHYCAGKAAVLSLTRSADLENRDKGVHVLGLIPGTVATYMQSAIRASGINPVSQLDPDLHTPPEAVARAIAWLCERDGAGYDGEDFSLRSDQGRTAAGLAAEARS